MAQYYTSVDLSSALSVGAATKDNKVYIAALDAPLIIQTPPVTLASQLHHDSVFAHLSVPDQFCWMPWSAAKPRCLVAVL